MIRQQHSVIRVIMYAGIAGFGALLARHAPNLALQVLGGSMIVVGMVLLVLEGASQGLAFWRRWRRGPK